MKNEEIEFMKRYPVFNISRLEAACKLSSGTIARALSGSRGLSASATAKVAAFLKGMGIK